MNLNKYFELDNNMNKRNNMNNRNNRTISKIK